MWTKSSDEDNGGDDDIILGLRQLSRYYHEWVLATALLKVERITNNYHGRHCHRFIIFRFFRAPLTKL